MAISTYPKHQGNGVHPVGPKKSKVERYNWAPLDEPGEYRWVPIGDVEVDPSYQRGENDTKSNDIARNWSWIACGVILLALRFGKYFIIDGQHRWLAAKKRGDIMHLPCMVYGTADIAAEAQAFLKVNNSRKPITGLDRYRAAVVAREPQALVVEDLLHQAGRAAVNGSSTTGVCCLSNLMTMAKQDEAALRRIWPLITEICDGRNIDYRLVVSLFYIERAQQDGGTISRGLWRDRIVSTGAEKLIEAAGRAAAYHATGGPKIWAGGMVDQLNYKCRHVLAINGSVTGRKDGE